MEFRPLDLTVIKARDLKDAQLIGKQDVYAAVSLNGDPRTRQRTHVDKDCGTKPKWNHKMRFTVDEATARSGQLTLVFQVVAERPIVGDKVIGELHVPVKELLEKANGDDHRVTYALRLPNGKNKGEMEFSYKFGEKCQPPPAAEHKNPDEPPMAYPPPGASSSGHPPPPYGAPAYPPPAQGYPAPPYHGDNKHAHAYPYAPPPGPGGYPPYQGYPYGAPGGGYPPQGYGGYPGYPPQGPYGYPPVMQPQKPKKHGGGAAGMALGLGAGLLGGLLVGEAVSDVADAVDDFGDVDVDF